MTDTYIWKKLCERLVTTIAKYDEEYSKNSTIIFPNDTDYSDANELWFEVFPLHTQPTQIELGSSGRNRWTLGMQININAPRPAKLGTDDVDLAYDTIAANFKRGDIFDGIRVLQTASRSSARVQKDYYSVPVTVMVQADMDN